MLTKRKTEKENNVFKPKIYTSKCSLGKFPFGEILVPGNIHREYVCQVTVHRAIVLGKLYVGEMFAGDRGKWP